MTPNFKEQLGCEGSMSQHDTLEPCPFCGALPDDRDVGDYFVSCPSCGIDGPAGLRDGREAAANAWNRRAALSATQPAQAAQGEPAEHWHRLYLEKCQQYNDRVAQLGGVIEGLEAEAAQGEPVRELKSALNGMLTFFGMDEDADSKPVFDKARKAFGIECAPYTTIDMGHGKWEVGAGTNAGLPCIAFGRNGSGKVGEPMRMDAFQMSADETYAVITFANVTGLDVLQEKVNEVRECFFAGSVPAFQLQPTVAQGAGEVVGVYGGTSNYGDIIVLYEDLKVGTKLYTQPAAGADATPAQAAADARDAELPPDGADRGAEAERAAMYGTFGG